MSKERFDETRLLRAHLKAGRWRHLASPLLGPLLLSDASWWPDAWGKLLYALSRDARHDVLTRAVAGRIPFRQMADDDVRWLTVARQAGELSPGHAAAFDVLITWPG